MRKLILTAVAVATAMPALTVATTADARRHDHYYDNRDQQNYQYREWRGNDGRYYCRRPDGTTGAVVGAVGGALIGRTIDTRGDRTLGTLGGAIAGGLAGRAIERSGNRQCR